MCNDLQPIYDRFDGSVAYVPCRNCSLCIANRITAFAGRAYAESLRPNVSFVALTLTYRDSSKVNSQVLVYSDFQKMIKRLRKDGYSVRYFVAGEYGSKRGRAHWHCVLYFHGDAPSFPPSETECQHWKYWTDYSGPTPVPMGFVFVQNPDYLGLLYVLKYGFKSETDQHSTRRVMFSKKPPLGSHYWPTLARSRISQGLPFSLNYTFPDITYSNGNPIQFRLSGASLELAYLAHRKEWHRLGNKDEPRIHVDDFESIASQRVGPKRSIDRKHVRTYGAARRWALSQLPVKTMKRCECVLTLPDGLVYKKPTGELLVLLWRNGLVTKWHVQNLRDLLALARGRGVPPPPPVLAVPRGLTPF